MNTLPLNTHVIDRDISHLVLDNIKDKYCTLSPGQYNDFSINENENENYDAIYNNQCYIIHLEPATTIQLSNDLCDFLIYYSTRVGITIDNILGVNCLTNIILDYSNINDDTFNDINRFATACIQTHRWEVYYINRGAECKSVCERLRVLRNKHRRDVKLEEKYKELHPSGTLCPNKIKWIKT